MSSSDDYIEEEDELGSLALSYGDGKTTVTDVIDALFEHVHNLQQFIAGHGHTEKEFKSWLKDYERRGMN